MPSRTGDMGRRDGFATLVESEFLNRSQSLMEEDLRKSDLDENDIYCTPLTHPPVPMNNPQWVLGGYRIPYWTRDGNTLEGMYRDRLFYKTGITERQLKEARMAKYRGPTTEQASVSGADARMPYLLPGGSGDLGIICEGEKKTAAALNRFQSRVLGIGGCWNWTDGSDSRGLHEDILWWAERVRTIIIIADPDIRNNRDIAQGYSGLRRRLQARFPESVVRVIALEDKVDDYLASDESYTLENLLREQEVAGLELAVSLRDLVSEYDLVVRTTQAGIVSVVRNAFNVHALLTEHPNWKGALKYNEDYGTYELYGQSFIEGHNDHQITAAFNKQLHLPDISQRMVRDGIRAVCLENTYSPACDDIQSVGKWDGTKRLHRIFGDGRSDIEQEVARVFVVGYIKRVLHPGCFWRYMTILVGSQGVGKTGMAKWLAGDEKRVAIFEHGELERADKDVLIRLMQAKIALFDDIDTFDNKERGKLKRLVTQTHTLQRGAYKEMERFYARSGIMMGTSNHTDIIPDDPTGNTRFVVVELTTKQDFDWLNEWRGQILAEAVALLETGWEPEIDFGSMDKFVDRTGLHDKVMEFCEALKGGIYDKSPYVVTGRKGKYWKMQLFWIFYGNGMAYNPKDWERKELSRRLNEAGLGMGVGRESSIDRTASGQTIKNVWKFP